LLLAGFLCKSADAFQRVTLRNGFAYDCARYEPLDDSHVRLFLTAQVPGTQALDFIDLSRESIATIETLPDPPQSPAPALAAVSTVNVPDLITAAGAQHHIDADLLASVIRAESGGRANAVSRTGARGLMQLMPGTAHQLGVNDAFRPDQNIAGGTTYLDQLLERYDPPQRHARSRPRARRLQRRPRSRRPLPRHPSLRRNPRLRRSRHE